MNFQITYQQEKGPEPCAFDEYALRAKDEYQQLLALNPSESDMQLFLERNPAFVPGAWTPGTKSGHAPIHEVLVTQPRLIGFNSKLPDFLWLSTHSGSWYAAMIEIERPEKRIFTKKHVPTAEFTQARNQLSQWRVWFDIPANVQLFMDDYGIPTSIHDRRSWGLHLILIYGRRSEFQNNPILSKNRSKLLNGSHEELISFDRLQPDNDLQNVCTVTPSGNGRFNVKWVPETFAIRPGCVDNLLVLDGLEEAIYNNPRISRNRADFLKSRIAYWKHRMVTDHKLSIIGGNSFRE